jgi:hypothetical protein
MNGPHYRTMRSRRRTVQMRMRSSSASQDVVCWVRSITDAFDVATPEVLAALVEPICAHVDAETRHALLAVVAAARVDPTIAKLQWFALVPTLLARGSPP